MSLFFSILARLFLLITPFYLQRKYHVFQYVYFLRVPLLIGLAMLAAPLILHFKFPEIAHNLFTLDAVGLLVVTILSIFLAWVVMYTSCLIFLFAAQHNKLSFNRDNHKIYKRQGRFKNHLPRCLRTRVWGFPVRLIVFGTALPSILIIIGALYSFKFDACATTFWIFPAWFVGASKYFPICEVTVIGLGVLLTLASWGISIHGSRRIRKGWRLFYLQIFKNKTRQTIRKRKQIIFSASKKLKHQISGAKRPLSSQHFFGPDRDSVFTRRGARIFGILSAVFYLAGYYFLSPDRSYQWPAYIPPLAYLLILMILLGWIFSRITLKFDRQRVPILLVTFAIPLLVQDIFGVDYFYSVKGAQCENLQNKHPSFNYKNAYDAWAGKRPSKDYPTMVVVAASGGGIRASLWSAVVLTKLQEILGQEFSKSIILISATSGGAVGTMYFLDAYTEEGVPNNSEDRLKIVNAASASSLGAIGWGFAYPDFWRAFLGTPLFLDPTHDRAWAQEQRWAQQLENPNRTLMEWRKGVEEGWRPIPIFNATISETGESLLLTSIDVTPSSKLQRLKREREDHSNDNDEILQNSSPGARGFLELYPQADMPVVTAARLSATFPLITPMARPSLESTSSCKAYHVADGGYTDNFGIFTVVNFLREILKFSEQQKVLLIEIRAVDWKTRTEPRRSTSLTDKFIGPLDTLLSANTFNQMAHNEIALQLLQKDVSRDGVEILPVIFDLVIPSPLSWHLSEQQKMNIIYHFPSLDQPPTSDIPPGLKPALSSKAPLSHINENKISLCQVEQFFGKRNTKVEAKEYCGRVLGTTGF